ALIGAIAVASQTAVKVDGKELPRGGGGPIPVFVGLEPGKSWKILIVLSQGVGSPVSDQGQRFGKTYAFPLSNGSHTIAIQCIGNSSAEVEFYWDGAAAVK